MIADHHNLLRSVLAAEEDAEEISTAGDSFLLALARPSSAVRFALRAFSRERGRELRDRIAIHAGEVLVTEGSPDLHGIQVDICARIMSLARGDQILLTRFAFDNARQAISAAELEGLAQLRWVSHGHYALKGLPDPVEVCEVGEEGLAVLEPPRDNEKARRVFHADDEPVLGWRPAVGQTVPGTHWVLREKLGEGGFGEVWLADHATLRTKQVFKFCFREERARSLKRELTLFRILKERVGHHPNIVGVNDVYLDEPPYFLGMKHVDGSDLAAWFEADGGASIPLATRIDVVAQVADALQAAHDAGIIHRDVKPSNILVEQKPGQPVHAYLTDFGIGQVTSDEALGDVTRLGFTMTMMSSAASEGGGTQIYMAPELLAGRPASIRSDIYSLGVILYQMVIGDIHQPLTTDWRARVGDPLLQEDLERCFAGDPEERFAGAAQLAGALRALEERRTERERLARQQADRERAAYRRGLLWATLGAAAVVLLVAGLAFLARREAARAEANYRSAQKVVDDLMLLTKGMAGDDASPADARLMPQRLADSALQNYREFLAQRPDDPALRLNLAKVCRSRALIYASTAGGDDASRRVARESMDESLSILRSLLAAAPLDPAVREEMANALAGVALDGSNTLGGDQDARRQAAAEALQLRRDLASGAPDSSTVLQDLADLLHDVSGAAPEGEDASLVSEEIGIREKVLGLSSGPRRPEALIALSVARERLAGLVPYPERGRCLGESYEAVAEPAGPDWSLLPLILRRLELATILAREERMAGNPAEAAAWVDRIEPDLKLLAASDIGLGSLAQARRREAEGLVESAQSKQGLPPQESLELLGRAVKIHEGLGGSDSDSFEPESLDGAWDALIRIAVAAGTPERALEAARAACSYWSAVYADPSRAAASWFRLANLQSAVGRQDEAGESLAEARRLQAQILRRSSEELNALALLLAVDADPRSGVPGSDAAGEQAVGVLREMKQARVGLDPNYRQEIESAFAGSAFSGHTEVPALLADLRDQAVAPRSGGGAIDVTDADALGRALRDDGFLLVKGVVTKARWTGTRQTLRLQFEGVAPGDFSAQVSADLQLGLEAKLGGNLEEVLPGLEVELGGYTYGYDGPPVLVVSSVDNFKVTHRAAASPKSLEVPVMPATDVPALRAAVGRDVTVEGDVADVVPHRSGLATTIQLDSGSGEALLGVVFSSRAPAIESKLGGALREKLLGQRIRLKGTLESYGGRNPAWAGWPQITLDDPVMIELVGSAKPLDVADRDGLARQSGTHVTAGATVGEMSRSPSARVLNIGFVEAGPSGLRAAVFPSNEAAIADKLGGSLESVLPGRRVRVSGKVTIYEGQPQIILSHPWQIDPAP